MRVIEESNWSWILYQDEDAYFLSVLCGGVAMYTIDIQLSSREALQYERNGHAYVKDLAKSLRQSPTKHSERHLQLFGEDEGAKLAVQQWRAQHAQKP